MHAGLALDIAGSYDGIGTTGYSTVTGKATVRVPLNCLALMWPSAGKLRTDFAKSR